jgi:uncharacterized repeat protein (TIGR02543 family)
MKFCSRIDFWFYFILSLLLILKCSFDNSNPFDPHGKNYVPPSFTVKADGDINDKGDTIHRTSARLLLEGNKRECLFQVKLNSNESSLWQPIGEFTFTSLSNGLQSVIVNCKYEGGDEIVSDTITFNVLLTTFTITYDGNEATAGKVPFDSTSYNKGAIITVKGNVANLSKSGFSFAGWATQNDGNGIIYQPGAEITNITGNIYLYAKWSKSIRYTIIYRGNLNTSGEPPSDGNLYESGVRGVVKGNTGSLKRTDYTFVGWNTAADGNGIDCKPGQEVELQIDHVILYAKWTQLQVCMITYNGNGNTGGAVPADSNVYETGSKIIVKSDSGKLVRNGFKFTGWNTRDDGNGKSYTEGAEILVTGSDVTLYAKWTQDTTFTITYDGNGNTSGLAPSDKNLYVNGDMAVVKPNASGFSKTGYRFTVWSTDKDGNGTRYAPSDTMPVLGNTVLFAIWNPIVTYSVIYEGNGNSSGVVPIDTGIYESGSTVPVLPNSGSLLKNSFVFTGWNTDVSGTGNQYYPGNHFLINSSVTLYAQWTQSTTYSITYNGNGNTSGTVPFDSNRYVSGSIALTQSNSGNLLKNEFSFLGWNTKTDGSGTKYSFATPLTIAGNIILYAQWSRNKTFTVTYDGNSSSSGSVPIDENVYESGNIVIVKANTGNLTRDGYKFTGWNISANGTGSAFTPNSELKIDTRNVILYAIWTKVTTVTFSITYNGNGNTSGSVPVDNTVYTFGSNAIILAKSGSFTKLGFTFAGWSTEPAGLVDSILMPRDQIKITGNINLYAVWTNKSTYKVVYKSNGSTSGAEPYDDNVYLPGASVTVLGNTGNLKKTNFTFVGWNTKSDGSGVDYTESATFPKNAKDDTLYANWSANTTYSIIYNRNNATSGSVPFDGNSYEPGVLVILKTNSGRLSIAGYTFEGWNTLADGKGLSFSEGDSMVMPAQNIMLYAQWKLIPTYTVTYNGNGNTSGTVPVDVTNYQSGVPITVKSNTGGLAKNSMNFNGWNTSADGSGIIYQVGSSFTMGNSSIILYAMWTSELTYTVSYNANGANSGNIPTDLNLYRKGDNVNVKTNAGGLALTGFVFAGWNTSSTGTGNFYAANSSFTMGTTDVSLWAVWQPVTYTVTFDDQYATTHVNPGTIKVVYPDTSVKMLPTVPAKTGHTFNGWFTSTSGTGTRFTASTRVYSNITVYAFWVPYFTLSYTGNGNTLGSSLIDTTKYLKGQTAKVLGKNTLQKDGFTFANWNTQYNAKGKFYAPDDTIIVNNSIQLHAAWKATITFDGQGATTGPSPASISMYHPDTLLQSFPANPLKTGFTFAGWYTAISGGTLFTASTKIAGNAIVYARWNALSRYTITYNGNSSTGGTVPVDTNTYQSGGAITVLGNTGALSLTGSTFDGWSRIAGTGKVYSGGDTLIVGSANIILYARWKPLPRYSVTYNGNGNSGGTVPVNTTTYLTGDSVIVSGNTGILIKGDSTFIGWSRVAGTGKIYKASDSLIVSTSNILLYARWDAISHYTVTYNGNGNTGGTAPVDSTHYISGEAATVSVVGTLVRSGYSFAGWNTAVNGGGTSYSAGASITITGNVTLYAKWTENPYTVSYNGNQNTGGSAPVDNVHYASGQSATVLGVGTLVRSGYSFTGWNTAIDGSGTTYSATASITITGNVTLYAKWTENPYTVSYNGNENTGGSAPVDNVYYASGQSATVLGVGTLVRSGYSFAGWNTAVDGSGTTYNTGASITITGNVTLYAKWIENPYTVNYIGNENTGGSVPVDNMHYASGQSATVLGVGTLVRSGYSFAGWNTAADGSGTTYAAGTSITMTGTITLYAKWTETPYSVTYDGNKNTDGSAPVDNMRYASGQSATVLGNGALVRTGYSFVNWNTISNGSGTSYDIGASISITGNLILYAQWSENPR